MFDRIRRRFAVPALIGASLGLAGFSAAWAQSETQPLTPEPAASETDMPEIEPAEGGLTRDDVEGFLDGFVPYALSEGDIAGAVVTVVEDGEILLSKGYGYSDLETRAPVDPARTLFRPGSISKLFTWTAVMQLVQSGDVSLDEDVNAYLDFEIPEHEGGPITLRHVMTHTAGFEETAKWILLEDLEQFPDLETYLKENLPPRVFDSGTMPAYSNYATALAGYIVAQVSGVSFDDYLDANIFDPLGMTRSTFRQPIPDDLDAEMSKGYMTASDGEPREFELVTPAPAGSLSATGEDMGRFMIAHLQGGGALLDSATAEQMHTTADRKFPPLNAMMLGFYEQDRNGYSVIGHGGDTIAFHSDLSLFLDEGVGLYISMNSAGAEGASGKIRSALYEAFADRYFPDQDEQDAPTLDTAAEHGAMVAGLYESSRGSFHNFLTSLSLVGQLKVSMNEDNELIAPLITETSGAPTRWREVEPFVWQAVNGQDRLTAKMEDGEVVALTMEPVSPIMALLPVPWWKSSGLLMPLLIVALIALALTALLWPVRAIVRWRYRSPFPLEGRTAAAYRAVRAVSGLTLVYLGLWAFLIIFLMSDFTRLTDATHLPLRLLQFAMIIPLGGLVLSLWNAFQVWTGASSWFGKLWSVVLIVAFLIVIWFASAGNLFSFTLQF